MCTLIVNTFTDRFKVFGVVLNGIMSVSRQIADIVWKTPGINDYNHCHLVGDNSSSGMRFPPPPGNSPSPVFKSYYQNCN